MQIDLVLTPNRGTREALELFRCVSLYSGSVDVFHMNTCIWLFTVFTGSKENGRQNQEIPDTE